MNVTIIGTGNVATVLGKRIRMAGHRIAQVYGRNEARASELAEELGAEVCSSWSAISLEANLYIIALSDKALYELEGRLSLGDRLVVHTAGSVSIDVLQSVSSRYGVLYPLQSLRKELDPLMAIPLLTDANDTENRQLLQTFAATLSDQVAEADDTERMKLHIAAVIASNFTNHLYALAETYCQKEQLDFHLLYPLIVETTQRIQLFSPVQMQTGPAVRNDEVTIGRHLSLLQSHPALQELYSDLTDSIKASERK